MTIESFLARLYADAAFRDQFLAEPGRIAFQAGLTDGECDVLAKIDREGLELAAASYARKRAAKQMHEGGGPIATALRVLRRAIAR